MRERVVVLVPLAQADGKVKLRPAVHFLDQKALSLDSGRPAASRGY